MRHRIRHRSNGCCLSGNKQLVGGGCNAGSDLNALIEANQTSVKIHGDESESPRFPRLSISKTEDAPHREEINQPPFDSLSQLLINEARQRRVLDHLARALCSRKMTAKALASFERPRPRRSPWAWRASCWATEICPVADCVVQHLN